MITNQRIIWDDDGTENDLSVNLNDFRSGSHVIDYVAADDYIYIASTLPFNHKWFEVSVANDQASVVSVDIWFGGSDGWKPAVDVIDRTADSGVALAQSGILQWKTNRLKGWHRELDSEDVTGIDIVGLYNMYWLRLSWSADLANTTALSFIGQKFSDDDSLYDYWPDLNSDSLKTSWEAGKTTWNDQHFSAAEIIIRDLKRRQIIKSSEQVLNFELFKESSCHKVAELIYSGLGAGYTDLRLLARKYYDESMNKNYFNVDVNRDGNLSEGEKFKGTGNLRR